MNSSEIKMGEDCCLKFDRDDTISIKDGEAIAKDLDSMKGSGSPVFTFDRVFAQHSTQQQVFEAIGQELVESVVDGFNGTVFVYGQTSSGKTFTMQGPDIADESLKGFIPRAIDCVFNHIENSLTTVEWLLKVSIYEIYMERIRDLLDVDRKDLKIREDNLKGVYVQGLSEFFVSSPQEIKTLLGTANKNRIVASTKMNEASSRSHLLFQLEVYQKDTQTGSAKTGKFILVDLAGSEKIAKTAAQGKTLEEAKKINLSLSALGNVINALVDPSSKHIPYRSSTLTRILQDSLGGNSLTSLVVTCSPSVFNLHETVSTLRFGQRAKKIKNTPKVNKEFTVQELLLLLEAKQAELSKSKLRNKYLEDLLKSQGIQFEEQVDKDLEEEIGTKHAEADARLTKTTKILSRSDSERPDNTEPVARSTADTSTMTVLSMANMPNLELEGPAGSKPPSIPFDYVAQLEESLTLLEEELFTERDLSQGLRADLEIMKADIEDDEKEISMLQSVLAQQQHKYTLDLEALRGQLTEVQTKLRDSNLAYRTLLEPNLSVQQLTHTDIIAPIEPRKHLLDAISLEICRINSVSLGRQDSDPVGDMRREPANKTTIGGVQSAPGNTLVSEKAGDNFNFKMNPPEQTSKFSTYFSEVIKDHVDTSKARPTSPSATTLPSGQTRQLVELESQLNKTAARVAEYQDKCALLSSILQREGARLPADQLKALLVLHKEDRGKSTASDLSQQRPGLHISKENLPTPASRNQIESRCLEEIKGLQTKASHMLSARSIIHSYLGRNPRIRMHLRSDLFADKLAQSQQVPSQISNIPAEEANSHPDSSQQEGLAQSGVRASTPRPLDSSLHAPYQARVWDLLHHLSTKRRADLSAVPLTQPVP